MNASISVNSVILVLTVFFAINANGDVTGKLIDSQINSVSDSSVTFIDKANANNRLSDSTYTRGNNKTDISGITFVSIPGGTFQIGDEVGDLPSHCRPVHAVILSGFKMSAYEITNSQYAKYLNEALGSGDIEIKDGIVWGKTGDCVGTVYLGIGNSHGSNNKCWITYSNNTFNVSAGKENWPVVFVTWCGAKAFAEYYGFDLPREAEWEYVCRGGKQYKYGTDDGTISDSKANYHGTNPVDVGSYPANPYGLYDMSGNVWEWCNDWLGYYSKESASNPTGDYFDKLHEENKSAPNPNDDLIGLDRVIRGGSWYYVDNSCRSALRGYDYPYKRLQDVGFRVVRR
jgi:formylglycine-generating enzyme